MKVNKKLTSADLKNYIVEHILTYNNQEVAISLGYKPIIQNIGDELFDNYEKAINQIFNKNL